jgi:EAL domain-containing protein (putative c-di-GMP-specific phosphodiesterase class I)
LDLYQIVLDGLDALQEPPDQVVVKLPDLAGGFLQAGVHIIEPPLKISRHFLLPHQLQLFLLQVVDPLRDSLISLIKILRDGALPGVFLDQGQYLTLQLFDLPVIFGGDEFLILIKNIKSYDELKKVTSRIMDVFEEPMVVQDIEYFITASAGVSVYPVDGENSETLIKNADIAMYRAKTCGKNQCIYCSPMIKDETITKMKLTNSLYRALDRNELYLNYQPQISAETQEIIGFEALLRWNNKEHGLVSPNIFIPMAEQTGLIRQIGLWTIKTACEDFKSFKKCYDKDIILSINLSIEQLKDNNIAEKINKILFDTETDAKDIQIEITESIAFNEDPNILQRLKDIRNLGIKISINDFGKGYSSFNRLKTFPIDLLKIDMDFVRGITAPSKKDRAIIKSIIQIAKNLNIEVLAEGVETKEQYTYLKYNGCDMIQGYYFYKPMPANEIESLISNPPGIKIS